MKKKKMSKRKLIENLGLRIMLFLIIGFFLILPAIHAETIVVGPGNEGSVYEQDPNANSTEEQNSTDLSFQEQLSGILEDMKATIDEKAYLDALTQRANSTEEKFNSVIEALKTNNEKLIESNDKKDSEISGLRQDLQTTKETLNSRIIELENNNTWNHVWLILVAIISMFFTILAIEYARAVTTRNKLYFKLRNIRDRFPLNPSVIFGRRD